VKSVVFTLTNIEITVAIFSSQIIFLINKAINLKHPATPYDLLTESNIDIVGIEIRDSVLENMQFFGG
jgi:hypothetical protein